MEQPVRETRIIHEKDTDRNAADYAARIVYLLGSLLVSLLLLRLLLVLLAANPNNGFVNAIYNISRPFVAPFFGIFNYTPEYGASRFELGTLVAIAVYVIIAWAVSAFIGLGSKRSEA